MDLYSFLIKILLAFLALYIFLKKKNNNKGSKLPPGPRSLPIIGHFHLLGKTPHTNLLKLAKKHGPIMYMKLGFAPVIVVSSPKAAEQFLKIQDAVFASRPPYENAKYVTYEQRDLSFSPYGTYWRNMRKMCTLELLSSHKIAMFRSMRKEEVTSMSADMSCRMVMGKKYEDKGLSKTGFVAVIQEVMRLTATPNLGDYYPYIGSLDLQGLVRKLKATSKVIDNFFEQIIDEHVQSSKTRQVMHNKDFVDILLEFMEAEDAGFRIDRRHVKGIMLDMLAGSMDTTATTIEWLLSELFKHPKILKKVQEELEKVVGLERMVEESDLEKLTYLEMVMKESFRLHPVGPLLIPHLSTKDSIVNDFHIPKNAIIIINVYAIGRDPNVWPDAEKFLPERFVGENIDVRGNDFRILPFGAGRRGCPGMQLGLIVVKFVVAQLVHCFEWKLPENMVPENLDMTEEFGLAVGRANILVAFPTYRLYK